MQESDTTRAGRRGVPTSRQVRLGTIAVTGAVCLFAAACSGTASTPGSSQQNGQAPGSPAASPPAQLIITPASGSTDAKTNRGISVTVTAGKITNVSVTAGQAPVTGLLAEGAQTWHTKWPLRTHTHYSVNATAINAAGKTTTATSSFRTLGPAATFTATTLEGHQSYGVGMPIVINFSQAVTHRAAVERAIQVKSSKPVVGAWFWDGNQTLEFRTQNYWPQHTKVSFTAHLNGLEAAPGVYGTANLSQSFTIGDSLIGVTSTRTHHTRIYWKGKLYAVWPDSSGMPGDDTADGTYLTIEKGNPVLMSGQGYKNVPVFFSVRFTWSGNYYHSAPWSLGEQGFSNVSHGCVNLSPQHAQWYYDRAVPGDPITITGSPVAGQWGDGYTAWFYSWKQLLKHSATHMAVQVSPTGSSFVTPTTLPTVGTSVLTGAKSYNYLAK
ncbi:MAG TPA: Ig-like domain-containing protein [Streptosporangiaceae bacterium]|nr:Ig-like domain-containing protein [Streptosporangiaceae bacterium]